jgi:DNA modification methylase
MIATPKTKPELTFKHNLTSSRHSWFRLTPAYSVILVNQILDAQTNISYVLDPFAGTSTTGLVCAERDLNCDSLDINPFLVWLGKVKTNNYTKQHLQETLDTLRLIKQTLEASGTTEWIPPISDINRWWNPEKLNLLSRIYCAIQNSVNVSNQVRDLLLLSFCKILIKWSNATFNHQSMSFKNHSATLSFLNQETFLVNEFEEVVLKILREAEKPISGTVNITCADARDIPAPKCGIYDCVITSPPYPNRMSYIRELRPYMYWLGYLTQAREAGELDWQSIGGTWGIATSRIGKWQVDKTIVDFKGFSSILDAISQKSPLLANYVHKYFVDIDQHLNSLFPVINKGGKLFYIVGNSKFYDTLVPVEEIYAKLLEDSGFRNVNIVHLRKRNSKKELNEFIVSAEKT